jgi:hypothetical protein
MLLVERKLSPPPGADSFTFGSSCSIFNSLCMVVWIIVCLVLFIWLLYYLSCDLWLSDYTFGISEMILYQQSKKNIKQISNQFKTCNLLCVMPDVARSVVLCICFVVRCLSFCTFSFGHYVVCSSSIYGFWLPFGIFKLFLHQWPSTCAIQWYKGRV